MDLQDKISLGAAMFATPAIDRGATTMLAEVVADATDGEVCVNLPDEEGTVQQVTVPCNGDIREGDMATLIVEDGRITAISASGEGERSKAETEAAQGAADAAQSTADTAQADATQAKTDAADAKETAAGAETAAGEAKDAADTAKSAADAAKDAADTAQSAADAADAAASEASGKADAAQSTADTASGKADAAQSAADAAQTSADAAKDAADAAQADATQAKTDAASASTAAAGAQALAEEANATATATGQHFFADDNGVHVTTDEGEAAGTHNLLANSEGVFIREGENPLTGMTKSGFYVYNEDGVALSAVRSGQFDIYDPQGEFDYCVEVSGAGMYLSDGTFAIYHDYSRDRNALGYYYTHSITYSSGGIVDADKVSVNTSFAHRCLCDDTYGDTHAAIPYLQADTKYDSTSGWTRDCVVGFDNYKSSRVSRSLSLLGDYIKVNDTNIMLLAYPVGSIYMSVNSTSPADLFGGTWEKIAGGRVLMGQNSTYAAGSTGGATTHTHTGPAHTHTYGARFGNYYGQINGSDSTGGLFELWNGSTSAWVTSKAGSGTDNNGSCKVNTGLNATSATKTITRPNLTTNTSSSGTGKTGSASSLMPYLSVYMWKRTA